MPVVSQFYGIIIRMFSEEKKAFFKIKPLK